MNVLAIWPCHAWIKPFPGQPIYLKLLDLTNSPQKIQYTNLQDGICFVLSEDKTSSRHVPYLITLTTI